MYVTPVAVHATCEIGPCHKTVTRHLFYYVYLRSSHLTLSPPAVNTPRRGPGEVIIFEETGIPCKKNTTWHAEVENRVLEFCARVLCSGFVLEFQELEHSIFDFCMPSTIFFARYSGFFEDDNFARTPSGSVHSRW